MEDFFGEIGKYVIWILIIGILLFLVIREFNCWYWKINKRINLQQREIELLESIAKKLDDLNDNLTEEEDIPDQNEIEFEINPVTKS
jgi:hypothetical protein